MGMIRKMIDGFAHFMIHGPAPAGKAIHVDLNMAPNWKVRNCMEIKRDFSKIFAVDWRNFHSISDGYTTDRKTSIISLMNEVSPVVGSTVKVCVTHIRNVDDFYVHIPEISAQFNPASLMGLKNQMNKPEIVKQYKPYTEKPSK